jgi:Tol biopolymer transport system component
MIARFDDFELDTTECRLSRNNEPVALEKLPLDLLNLLVERHGELVSSWKVAPTWSPDGSRLLIRCDQPGLNAVAVFQNDILEIVNVNSHQAATIPDSAKRFNQRWSPDGKWIVATPNNESEIEMFEVASNRWTVLAKMHADYPSWPADSQFVYFEHNTDKARRSTASPSRRIVRNSSPAWPT